MKSQKGINKITNSRSLQKVQELESLLQICTRLPRYARRLLDDPRLLDHLCTHQASQQINTKKKKGEEEVLLKRLCLCLCV